MKTKFQKGEEDWVQRTQIKEAPYNPRIIGEGAEKRFRKKLKTMGLLGTLIWNKRSGMLVSGHQRLKQLDVLEGYPTKTKDYEIRVTVVDLNEKEEKEANIFLNNPSAQGEWDIDALGDLLSDGELTFDDAGFTDADARMLFGGDERFDAMFIDNEEVSATKEQIDEVRNHRKESLDEMQKEQSADFYFTVICQTQQDKERLVKAIGAPAYEYYVNGAHLARKLGVELEA